MRCANALKAFAPAMGFAWTTAFWVLEDGVDVRKPDGVEGRVAWVRTDRGVAQFARFSALKSEVVIRRYMIIVILIYCDVFLMMGSTKSLISIVLKNISCICHVVLRTVHFEAKLFYCTCFSPSLLDVGRTHGGKQELR